jgi:cytochrome c1
MKDPNAVKPGSEMPPYAGLPEEELNALARYLAALK